MSEITYSKCYDYFAGKQKLSRELPLNEEEFAKMYKKFFPKVVAQFRRKGFPVEDARELAQDVFTKAYRKRHQLQSNNEYTFLAWLNTIVASIWKNTIRARQSQKREGEEVTLQEQDLPTRLKNKDPLNDMLGREKESTLVAAIKSLPDRQRAVLILRVYHELTYAQIANVMKVSESVVRNVLFQARTSIRAFLNRGSKG